MHASAASAIFSFHLSNFSFINVGLIAVVTWVGNEHGRRNDYEGGEGGESADFGGESRKCI